MKEIMFRLPCGENSSRDAVVFISRGSFHWPRQVFKNEYRTWIMDEEMFLSLHCLSFINNISSHSQNIYKFIISEHCWNTRQSSLKSFPLSRCRIPLCKFTLPFIKAILWLDVDQVLGKDNVFSFFRELASQCIAGVRPAFILNLSSWVCTQCQMETGQKSVTTRMIVINIHKLFKAITTARFAMLEHCSTS